MNNFWQKLPRPFFILAPMANVTDWAFRKIIAKCGRPDVFYTEFLSCDGIVHDKMRFEKELYFEKYEKPLVVQFFGSKPENFYKCAQFAQELGFDGIDINMGCPDRSVEKQGAGAALINNPRHAQEIIKETKRGAGKLPVSVKTRIGYNKIETKEWIPKLLEMEPATITVHGRTRKEMSKVPAHWDEIGKAAALCRKAGIPVVGNGDIMTYGDGLKKAEEYGLDGIMVGRAIFSNPWFFDPSINPATKTPEERITLMTRHLQLFSELWGKDKHFDVMKKFFKVYISGWEGAKELRTKLMNARSEESVIEILKNK
ncbi:MAG: tRNA-dihydrouridine synthase [Candidatus Yanofskybacteria bacterium]|nr:tRNA-dihydrouridine synthase [Candidatus Yanofskybacteria bacterium]